MDERAGLETPNHGVAGSNPIRCKALLTRGFFFLFYFIKLLFCLVLDSVCEAKLRLCA